MSLKDILVHVDATRGHEARLRLAVALARRHGAHLTGLFILEPMSATGLGALGGADVAQAETFQILRDRYHAARLELGARLAEAFRGEADRAGIVAEWQAVEGEAAATATLQARYADLAVLGQADPDQPGASAAVPEAVLLGAGRPALIVPYIGAGDAIGRRVLVAWNATREAARAVNDALPLLADAEMVTVLSINPARGIAGEGDVAAADMARHLARHGVKAEAAYAVAEDITVGDVILSRAADLGSDLIVMGGYGHSRAREFVLGGATRSLLQHMTVPVLMSH
jgi:nucleotide-binding universal stress UspA family protein